MILGRGDAAAGFKNVLDFRGANGNEATYAVILGHLAARLAGDEAEAKAFLDVAPGKLNALAWPYPVVRLLRGEIDESALLAAATDNDKLTEARCYLGVDQALKGHRDSALVHFRWVRDQGNAVSVAYALALAELERLEKPEAKSPAREI